MYYIYELKHHTLPYKYIGYTQDLKQRYSNHKKRFNAGKCKYKLYQVMKKHGFESFNMFPIDTALTKKQAMEKEKMYIQKLKATLNSHHAYYDDSDI